MKKEEQIYETYKCNYGKSDGGFVSEFYWADLEATRDGTGKVKVEILSDFDCSILFHDTMSFNEWERFKRKLENDNYDVTEYIIKGTEGKR